MSQVRALLDYRLKGFPRLEECRGLRVRGRGSKLADAKLGASLGSVCLRASSGVGYRVNGRKKGGRGIVVCSAAAAAAAGGADRGYGVARSRGSSDDEESSHQEEISLLPFVNNTRQPSHVLQLVLFPNHLGFFMEAFFLVVSIVINYAA
jgi:hypothetical protein